SSRRRHTRFSRDWSSDVCSSDLNLLHPFFHVDIAAHLRANADDITRTYLIGRQVEALAVHFDMTVVDDLAGCPDGRGITGAIDRSEERRVGKGGRDGGRARRSRE